MEVFARRLQLQERLTHDIAQAVMDNLNAKGVVVLCEAEHTCMTCRGIKKAGSKTLSYSVAGDFPEDKKTEALALIK